MLLGETGGGLVILVAATLGAAATSAALDAGADARWLGIACAGMAGVLPGGGTSLGLASAISGAFGASASGRWAGGVVAPLTTIAVILVSLAVFRMYSASNCATSTIAARGQKLLVLVLATASVLVGAALGAGSSPFGGHTAPLARRLVSGTGGLDGAPRIVFAALGLSLAAAAIGLVAARRATRTPQPPPWVAALGGPARLVAGGSRTVGSLVTFFVRSVVIMNEDVIDDILEVIGGVVARVGAGLGRIDTAVAGGRIARALGGGAVADPADPRFERLRTGLVLGMVALLGLVVLSSMVLG